MKDLVTFLVVIALMYFIACSGPPVSDCTRMRERIVKDSTELAELRISHSELVREISPTKDSLRVFKFINDSLKTQVFLAKYKVVKVRKYLNICLNDKTNSQDKYLKGWIKRAIE